MSQEERIQFVKKMRHYWNEESIWLRDTLESIGWNEGDLQSLASKATVYDVCPFVSHHQMPSNALSNHILVCEKKYDYYRPSAAMNSKAALATKTTTGGVEKPTMIVTAVASEHRSPNFNDGEKSTSTTEPKPQSSMTYVHLLEAERNAKRRKMGYRAKKVTANKNNYTQTLKELIKNEMRSAVVEELYCNNATTEHLTSKCEASRRVEKEQFCYAGVGDAYYNGNPFKRWQSILENDNGDEKAKKKEGRRCAGENRTNDFHRRHHSHKRIDSATATSHLRRREKEERDGKTSVKCHHHSSNNEDVIVQRSSCSHDRGTSAEDEYEYDKYASSTSRHSRRREMHRKYRSQRV